MNTNDHVNVTPPSSPIKVAVIGGGPAAMSAVMHLTDKRQRARYQITVYQMGWRLGGKCASGRGRDGRIEEHGLHALMGFYENTFRMLRTCYDELDRDPTQCKLAKFTDAFIPDPNAVITDRRDGEGWDVWAARYPKTGDKPGDPLSAGNPFTVRHYMVRASQLLLETLRSIRESARRTGVRRSARGAMASLWHDPLDDVDRVAKYVQLVGTVSVLESARALDAAIRIGGLDQNTRITNLLDRIQRVAGSHLDIIVEADLELRRLWTIVDAVLTVLRGILRFNLITDRRGFDAINDHDWLDWLAANGAHPVTLNSGFNRGCLYDLTFAFVDGDPNRPAFAAGVALRSALRLFMTYRGSLFWRMSAGMGDVIFAPLYEVLKRRGVRFEFFHRLTNVGIDEDHLGKHVSSLDFDVQAETIDGKPYAPLVDVDGVPCWPNEPIYDQLVDGASLREQAVQFESQSEKHRVRQVRLPVRSGFDFVILGTPIGVIPAVCSEILQDSHKWRDMVSNVTTVATQAMQLWLNEPTHALGWPHPPANLSGFAQPFATWADFSHLADAEIRSDFDGSIAYFCSVMPNSSWQEMTDHEEILHRLRTDATAYLNNEIGWIWPDAVDEQGFRWHLLLESGEDAAGPHLIDNQYIAANYSRSARYVQSLPGSIEYRLSPLEREYDNLTIAGDWTRTGLDAGCIESAVMSGMLASHALSEMPTLEEIVGYDHP